MKNLTIPIRDVARELARRFSTMTYEELDVLENIIQPMKFSKGEKILNNGEVSKYIYFLYQAECHSVRRFRPDQTSRRYPESDSEQCRSHSP